MVKPLWDMSRETENGALYMQYEETEKTRISMRVCA